MSSPVRLSVSDSIAAPPAKVYEVLADYVDHHPRILPKPEFESLKVEKGGRGAGTVFLVGMKVVGQRSAMRMVVSEPEPGRVLQEASEEGGVVTRFVVTPEDAGRRSRVEIASEWARRPGFRGWVEARVNPMVARRLYRRELRLIDEYVRTLR